MAKLDANLILKQIADGNFFPVYWIYGPETYKIRELTDRLKRAVSANGAGAGLFGGPSQFNGNENHAGTIIDEAQSMSLGGGVKFLVVRDADHLKNAEDIRVLFGEAKPLSELNCVCVFISQGLDQRKKFTKELVSNAAVIQCEEVREEERENWTSYLAKQMGVSLDNESLTQLATLDPWSLELIENEIKKYSLNPDIAVLGLGDGSAGAENVYLEALFERNAARGLGFARSVSSDPAVHLPLLGLLSWNARHLALVIAESTSGSRTVKINPYVAQKLSRWKSKWSLEDAVELQHALHDIDFATKQTPKLALGLWSELMTRFSL
ncbi:MAG: hypothetical protein KA715_06970 [Xanthomonadaceae bacterium]|nr:hypothetical protein [Xanthomonadaceae bacterium]